MLGRKGRIARGGLGGRGTGHGKIRESGSSSRRDGRVRGVEASEHWKLRTPSLSVSLSLSNARAVSRSRALVETLTSELLPEQQLGLRHLTRRQSHVSLGRTRFALSLPPKKPSPKGPLPSSSSGPVVVVLFARTCRRFRRAERRVHSLRAVGLLMRSEPVTNHNRASAPSRFSVLLAVSSSPPSPPPCHFLLSPKMRHTSAKLLAKPEGGKEALGVQCFAGAGRPAEFSRSVSIDCRRPKGSVEPAREGAGAAKGSTQDGERA